jgi:hypothetical protein
MSSREISLKVADAKQRDVGQGKVRIDNDTMQKGRSTYSGSLGQVTARWKK